MILTADYLLTGDKKTIIPNGAVMIEGKKIVEVGSKNKLIRNHPDQPVISYPGCTIMPGLIDLHNHISYTWGTPLSPLYERFTPLKTLFAVKRMKDTLENGVTTIRDVASADLIGPSLNYGSQLGYIDAPRIFTSNRGIAMTGGHGWSLKGGVVECDGPEEAIKVVRQDIRDGATCIKILTSEGYRGTEMTQEEINAVCNEAHRLGVRVASHAGYDPAIMMSIVGGCDTIEHGTHLTEEEALIMRLHDQTWVPTIYGFQYLDKLIKDKVISTPNAKYCEEAVECYKNNLRKLYDLGVRVACGTDTDCLDYPEAAPVYLEAQSMVECGLTPMEVIECATKNGAEALGKADEFGQLKENLSADILIVSGKPFTDIKALHNVKEVYLEGALKVSK